MVKGHPESDLKGELKPRQLIDDETIGFENDHAGESPLTYFI